MGTGTAVAKPSPRCIAETEDGRGRAAEGNSDGTCTRGGRSNPGPKSAMPHLART